MALDNWNLVTDGTKPENLLDGDYMERVESGHETYSPGNSSASRVFVVQWDLRGSFLDDCLGYSYLDEFNQIHRTLPDPHPFIQNFYAMESDVRGVGPGTNRAVNGRAYIDFPLAEITVSYRPRDYAVLSDEQIAAFSNLNDAQEIHRYVTRKPTYASEYLTYDGTLKWVTRASHDPVAIQPSILTSSIAYNLVWHEVPGKAADPYKPPTQAYIVSLLGNVNSTTFDGNPAGTVLFVGADVQMMTPRLADSEQYWELTYSFLVRNNGTGGNGEAAGHQQKYDGVNSRWDLITTDGTAGGGRMYRTADLNLLFQIPA